MKYAEQTKTPEQCGAMRRLTFLTLTHIFSHHLSEKYICMQSVYTDKLRVLAFSDSAIQKDVV